MTTGNILNVTEADFEFEVVAHSERVPVVVDFWAEWCKPCKILGPTLEQIAEQADGRFRLAKVDIEANPNLAMRYDIRSIPNVKAFRHGQVVGEFTGAQPEGQIRNFLSQVAPDQNDLALEKGEHLLHEGQWQAAEESFKRIVSGQPAHPAARLGLAKSFIAQGKSESAIPLLLNFPPSKEYTSAERLTPLAEAIARSEQTSPDPDDLQEASFQRSLVLIRRGNLPAAMDGLLEILRKDKNFRGGEVKKVLIGIFELLGDENELTRQYRKEMASVLF
ncbi:MAG TPA: thioredoxin [Anaerolineales bacterium]|nr:thioredoxin [Anaerolineales bacterium]